MKLTEVMIIRNDGLKLFQVDDSTIAKLTRIRGNFYRDDPRLRVVKDLPTPEPEISQAAKDSLENAFRLYKMPVTSLPIVKQPEPPKILSFEEQVIKDWRTRPDIRAEFVSLASYAAYCKAIRDGRTKLYGCKS